MAKNKKKSFSKVNVSQPKLSLDNNEQIKLDENNILSKESIEISKVLILDEPINTEEDIKISHEQSYTQEDNCSVSFNDNIIKLPENTNLIIESVKNKEVIALEIVKTEVTQELEQNNSNIEEKNNSNIEEQNIPNNEEKNNSIIEEKNKVEISEIQIKNEGNETSEKKLTNCSRKFCTIL
jgi:hypothetical protein